MNLSIIAVHNQGNANEEYVFMYAKSKLNLKYYMVCDTTYQSNGKISNKFKHPYWFIDKEVQAGEYVVLWTGKGTYERIASDSGDVEHHFFWGSSSPIWNNSGDAAVLFELKTWHTTRAK